MSNVLQIQFITGCSSWCRCQHPKKNTQTNTCTHSSHSHHCLRRRILKVCFFTKLGRGGRIFSFSPLSSRCVFAREWSSAGQVISLSQREKDSVKLSQGSKEGCLHNILLPLLSKHALFYILQLKELFFFDVSVTFILSLSHLNVEVFGVFLCAFCSYIWLLILCCIEIKYLCSAGAHRVKV